MMTSMKGMCLAVAAAIPSGVFAATRPIPAKRLEKEFQAIEKDGYFPANIVNGEAQAYFTPDASSNYQWTAWINGPPDTPYEGGKFQVEIDFPKEYPMAPPKVKFLTKIYHCNINSNFICLSILKGPRERLEGGLSTWNPGLQILTVLKSLEQLLEDPEPNDPLVGHLGALARDNRAAYDNEARKSTQEYAKPEFFENAKGEVRPKKVEEQQEQKQSQPAKAQEKTTTTTAAAATTSTTPKPNVGSSSTGSSSSATTTAPDERSRGGFLSIFRSRK